MTQSQDADRTQLPDLFASYLRQQIEAQAQGLGYAEPTDEVVPHDATPVQPIDPKLAWTDGLCAVKYLTPAANARTWTVPPAWAGLVANQEPALSLAFALGNFPQLVRNLQPLLNGERTNPTSLSIRPIDAPGLLDWAESQRTSPQVILAAGVLRLARHFDRADDLLSHPVSAGWEIVRDNERAALAWHRGESEKARKMWQALPDSVVVLFNRGMAGLFLDRAEEAREMLTRAVAGLPETSAWHHLGHLYLALAAMPG